MRVASTPTRSRAPHPVRDPMASTHLLLRSNRHRRTFVLPSVALPRRLPIRVALRRLGHERTVAVAIAGIVLGASLLSVSPGGLGGDTGGPTGDGPAPRLGIGGPVGDDGDPYGRVESAYVDTPVEDTSADEYAYSKPMLAANAQPRLQDLEGVDPAALAVATASVVEGPFLDDGTLLKPVAVDTSVADGSGLIRTYKVRNGDTLAGIAAKFDVTTMTLWWANKLKAKDALVRGQVLKIPPVSGLVVQVKATDTLASLAQAYHVPEDEILATNQLEDRHLVVGQVLVLPDALGAPIVTKKPTTKAPTRSTSSGHSSGSSGGSPVRTPRTYSGGNFLWPTTSHHISQYFHYGHYAIDIDGSTGDPIWAAAAGTVTFSGWKNNGGGYQVWISHGSGLYTTYNHMSSVSVARGQHVGRGQRVGRMGATGFATGSHLHFEVWKGPVWDGGTRVNPLAYL
jgi:murein DD-endopeptidase MepM/ murein hydrolase activator NlpD